MPVEELVLEEQLGAIEEAVPAEERITEEAGRVRGPNSLALPWVSNPQHTVQILDLFNS